jgi:hypothetical protein
MNFVSFDWSRSARRHALWLAMGLSVLAAGPVGCGGCGDEEAEKSAPKEEQAANEDASSKETDTMERMRSAFGLPLPPSVRGIEERGDEIRVKTRMSLDEIEAFFKTRLTDYEVLRPGDQVRAVGLREFMPQVYAYPYGPYSFVVYMPAPTPDEAADGADDAANAKQASAKTKAAPKVKPLSKRKRGEPVMDRTSDGELLAPGARWGEPYTPPPGSPLHKEHLRSNFGQPYGEWVLQ